MASPSLYRRYRPRRFGELKGQDHVVRALRDAVAAGREGQAYVFSGPRGTGKTTSARILAKVLNCDRPVEGEPCCECTSCLAVERGTSDDVHELDAASNNGGEAMRDLIDKAQLGTPGRHKVYILDEVHMLSKPAEAALLKTLEEPPPHVVFVLATTDPQKVSDTIRSRTQHLRFHLLPPETLVEHVRWVAADAGLDLDAAAIDAAVAQGGGSARDTLSALELIASAGGATLDALTFDEFVDALIDHDPGLALTAMAHAVSSGHEPRAVAEALVRHLRDLFLSMMAPELVQRSAHEVDELAAQAQRAGPAALVRAIERLGEILVELRHAPDPRVLVEVALVQLTTAPVAVDDDLSAIAARVAKLEQAATAVAPTTPNIDASTGRAALGDRARRPDRTVSPVSPVVALADPLPDDARPEPTAPARLDVVRTEWEGTVRPALKGLVRALFTPVDVVGIDGDRVAMATPNETHRTKCEEHRGAVEAAWAAVAARTVSVQLGVGGVPPSDAPAPNGPPAPGDPHGRHDLEDLDDLHDLTDAGPVPSALDRLAQAFPGAEVIEGR
ncbi:MAG: DNA polymerase III subunit gamma/tau [Ilumatobacteraceae bacterium]